MSFFLNMLKDYIWIEDHNHNGVYKQHGLEPVGFPRLTQAIRILYDR
jgi:hypothetical protein